MQGQGLLPVQLLPLFWLCGGFGVLSIWLLCVFISNKANMTTQDGDNDDGEDEENK